MLARRGRGHRDDPVRADASRWLVRLRDAPDAPPEVGAVVGELQRLRFGARASWQEPEQVFRQARQAWRVARSARGRVTRP
jgi:hypothetical protein